ncbi:MAG: phosphoenolpyruvate carboxylase [Cloacibacterium sp.]
MFQNCNYALKRTFKLIKEDLIHLAKKISISAVSNPVPFQLSEMIQEKVSALGEMGKKAVERNHYEQWRQFVNLMICQLENTITENFEDSKTYYKSSKALQEDLKNLREVLVQKGFQSIAEDLLFSVERAVQCFGFHLAKLDIRQNSAFHESMPEQTVFGTVKITVQGESVAQLFGNPMTAKYNLNALSSGTARHIIQNKYKTEKPQYPFDSMEFLAQKSFEHYRNLIETPGFINFYGKATCIDVLEKSKIGSRPARRTGTRTLQDLRAIPWVFSWNLSRIALTGWYGLGEALKILKSEKPQEYQQLKEAVQNWNFFKFLMIQTETNLILSNIEIMKKYAELDQNEEERNLFMDKFLTDHQNGVQLLEELFGEAALERRSGQYDNLKWRNQKLDVLHHLHLHYLQQWRNLDDENKIEKDKILNKLLSLINAISSGLKNTG